ncbi:MAG: amidohydrolase family protein [Acidimicrobiia bacterium]
MVIDVHAHCIPDEFRDWLVGHGPRVGAEIVEGRDGACVQFRDGPRTGSQYSWPSMSDTGARIAEMDRMGIDVQLLSGWIDLAGYEVPVETALEYARAHNEALAAVEAVSPTRFRTLGTAPLQDPSAATAALEHAIGDLGMAGLQLATRVGDRFIHEQPGLEEFWAAAAGVGALLVLHPLRPLSGVDLAPYFLENTVGRPAESSIALAGLLLSGVLARHPDLKLCVVHGGGFVPFQLGRLDRSFREVPGLTAQAIDRPPSSYMESVYVDTIVHDPTALRFLIDRLGPGHVVLGTDYPFPMGDDDPVALVDSVAGLAGGDREAILGGNLARLLS